jgi:hypothetical protein
MSKRQPQLPPQARPRRRTLVSLYRPQVEVLEGRWLPSTFLVTNTDDFGAGSFRQAILDANDTPGTNEIDFAIGSGGLQTIYPATDLPTITRPVTIDGTTQPGFAGQPLIELDGQNAGGSAMGLTVAAGPSTVTGLVIHDFASAGIAVQGDDNIIVGNWIGTDAMGTTSAPNGYGIVVTGNRNRIGGTAAGQGNLISGNRLTGIDFQGHFKPPDASDNLVQSNLIGTDITGSQALGNGSGITISGGALNNTIGGVSSAARNIISANRGPGIDFGFGDDNRAQGNFIGTDVTGTFALGNVSGVVVSTGNNLVGGAAPGAGNLISGNTLDGVSVSRSGPVQGNFIGTDVTGTRAIGNGTGVTVTSSAIAPLIGGSMSGAGNLIAGNRGVGLNIDNGHDVLVQGNRIGTDVTGSVALPNRTGVIISSGSGNTIGGAATGAGNIISGNTQDGIDLLHSSANQILGDSIGADSTGTLALGNQIGIYIFGGTRNTVGGSASGAGNLISGNSGAGIDVVGDGNQVLSNLMGTDAQGSATLGNRDGVILTGSDNIVGGNIVSGNTFTGVLIAGNRNSVPGNFIGTDQNGKIALANRDGLVIASGTMNVIGGPDAGQGNLIAGNQESGVAILDGNGNQVEDNLIGTDVTGTAQLGNRNGVMLASGTTDNIVGPYNVIAGNRGDGVSIAGSMNRVEGNLVGIAVNGTAALGNSAHGVDLTGGSNNTIGGTTSDARNVISANQRDGIYISGSGNQILGNYIGTDANGAAALGNTGSGVNIQNGTANAVGGASAGAGNLIAANGQYGVLIFDSNNLVQGNDIGTDVTGTVPLGNNVGVYLFRGSMNLVGGTASGAGNLISGNGTGVTVFANGSVIQGNLIGTDGSGTKALGNRDGVVITSGTTDVVVGGATPEARNVISGNLNTGVFIITSSRNLIQGNFIGTDVTGMQTLANGTGVILSGGLNNLIGGSTAGAGNLISGNAIDGVHVYSSFANSNFIQGNTITHNGNDGVLVDTGSGNGILGNVISDSGNLGIELVNNGNHNQAFPVLTSAVSDGVSTTIEGTLTSTPRTDFTLEFFADTICNPSGFGEGERLLGSTVVTTDTSGNASFTVTFNIPVDPGQFISATATDPANNTSQFSQCVEVAGAAPPMAGDFPALTITPESPDVMRSSSGIGANLLPSASAPQRNIEPPIGAVTRATDAMFALDSHTHVSAPWCSWEVDTLTELALGD